MKFVTGEVNLQGIFRGHDAGEAGSEQNVEEDPADGDGDIIRPKMITDFTDPVFIFELI